MMDLFRFTFVAFEQYKGYLQSLPFLGYFFTIMSEVPQHPGSNLLDVNEDFHFHVFFWAMLFYSGSLIIVRVAETEIIPQEFAAARATVTGAERIRWLHAYVASLLHHIVLVSLSFWYIYNDLSITPYERSQVDYTRAHTQIIFIVLGYFVQDFIVYAIPKKDISYMFHHVALFILIGFVLHYYKETPGYLFKFAPYVALTEVSSLFFCIAWILRTFQIREGQRFCEVLFAICFLFFRILCLPLPFTSFLWSRYPPNPIVAVVMFCLMGLQFYWMGSIIRSAVRKSKND